jgi:hypothetical protein
MQMATDSPYDKRKVATDEAKTPLPKQLQAKTVRETESDHLHAEKEKIKPQPLGPYNRDDATGDNPEVDDITEGDEAQSQREKTSRMAKAEGDR